MMAASVPHKTLVKSKSGLKIVCANDDYSSPFVLNEPLWIPDNDCHQCMNCNTKFDFVKRRHHCRRCGSCFCSSCTDNKVPLPRMCFVDPVRLCSECSQLTRKENEFFDRHLKTLTSGAQFDVISTLLSNDHAEVAFVCRLSSDHRCIVFDGGQREDHESLELRQINSCQMIPGLDPQGNTVATGLNLLYRDSRGENQSIQLLAPSTLNKKQSMLWISALQKGMKIVYDTKCNSPEFVDSLKMDK
ncbi:zinc finger FYVE domain-containing protein 21-like [Tubulanus polymorphus]|uniref:zinc finger FYVE domain-containing protein 21-like n=1 Tax=Tubulanus polymorphus TaxID=672921 RepID=UPI003DA69B0B